MLLSQYIQSLYIELFTQSSLGGILIILVFLFTSYVLGVIFNRHNSDLLTSHGQVCAELGDCIITMIKLALYSEEGLEYLTAVINTNNAGYISLLFIYMIFNGIILFNGLIGVYAYVFVNSGDKLTHAYSRHLKSLQREIHLLTRSVDEVKRMHRHSIHDNNNNNNTMNNGYTNHTSNSNNDHHHHSQQHQQQPHAHHSNNSNNNNTHSTADPSDEMFFTDHLHIIPSSRTLNTDSALNPQPLPVAGQKYGHDSNFGHGQNFGHDQNFGHGTLLQSTGTDIQDDQYNTVDNVLYSSTDHVLIDSFQADQYNNNDNNTNNNDNMSAYTLYSNNNTHT